MTFHGKDKGIGVGKAMLTVPFGLGSAYFVGRQVKKSLSDKATKAKLKAVETGVLRDIYKTKAKVQKKAAGVGRWIMGKR